MKKLFECVGPNKFRLNNLMIENVERISANTYSTTIVDPETEQDVEVTIEIEYVPGEKGSREPGTGLQLTPDYDPEVRILSITDKQGKDYTDILPKNIVSSLIDDIHQDIADYAADSEEGHGDFLRQQDQDDRL